MNANDRRNLQFLLSASEAELASWYAETEEDDHEYAAELLTAYAAELKREAAAAEIEIKLTGQEVFPEAAAVLSKFRKA